MPLTERVQRRLATSQSYERASDRLGGFLDDFGPSQPILSALALEVRLKALLLAYGQSTNISHSYSCGWSALPCEVRKDIISRAEERYAGHVDYGDLKKLLDDAERTFVAYRYDYEVNEARSADEIGIASDNWANPDFEFHPMEIKGLLDGMEKHLKEWIERSHS
ncbi:hypothetical protein [Sulfitobacter mediterraneus]|uniref:hypothetical protein n=1 Tax=Sulfitobacter mediterraneus TaxID=83219 RepID=UPI0021A8AE56|nr:hypothetical protein [Sulfitobacter mediterraneus]UWR12954.1 hypothetical protein K3753_08920 [Sulfitobacter mediterraneus]